MATDNKSLGRFILDGIPPAPRGMPQVEVTFDLDVNGILSVKAKDKATSKEQSIRITGSTGLTKDEVEKMTKEAEAHAEEDQKRKTQTEARNQADGMIFTAEKTLKDLGDKAPADAKKGVEDKIAELKKDLDSATVDQLKTKTEELSAALQKVGAAMYGQGQPQAGPSAGSSENPSTPPPSSETDTVEEGKVVS